MKGRLKEIAEFASKIIHQTRNIPEKTKSSRLKTGVVSEKEVIEEARDFLSRKFEAEVIICSEDEKGLYDPEMKARLSAPHRPAIYIE